MYINKSSVFLYMYVGSLISFVSLMYIDVCMYSLMYVCTGMQVCAILHGVWGGYDEKAP